MIGFCMTTDISDLKLPLQRMIDYGIIDSWFRGIAAIVPQASGPSYHITQERDLHTDKGMSMTFLDMNMHILSYVPQEPLAKSDIERMVGFNQLISACGRNDVYLRIAKLGGGSLEVEFDPETPFTQSVIFGANYANVLPVIFGIRDKNPKTSLN